MPGKSILPVFANWLAPVVRGLFAMVPPPPPASPCPGIPSTYTGGGQLVCAPCPYDASRLCSFVDTNGDGIIDPGEPAPSNLIPLPASPTFMRGFDDPQADPDTSLVFLRTVEIEYVRGDLYDLPPQYIADDVASGNPPWGSCPGLTLGCSAAPDNDADGKSDTGTIGNRHNQGAYSAISDKDRPRPFGQVPSDAFAGPSCPLGILGLRPLLAGLRRSRPLQHVQGLPGHGARGPRPAGRLASGRVPAARTGFGPGLADRALPPRVARHRLPRRQLAGERHQAAPPLHDLDRQLQLGRGRGLRVPARGGRQGSRGHGVVHAARRSAPRRVQLLQEQRL